MKKRTLCTSSNTQMKLDTKNKGVLDLEDWVSQLPDDNLVNIISRLTVKEAARTSVLSSRWKCVWTCSTTLNFDDPQKLLYVYNIRRALDEERCKYISWVNRVLELRGDSDIKEFRIRFNLKDFHKSDINHWIYTAIDKGVEKLELNLKPYNGGVSYEDRYTFSEEFFNKLKTIPHFLLSVNALRSLRLEAVNITKEILEFFIYNCPFLEQLLVAYSSTLLSLKVVGSSIQLKCLHIYWCHLLEEIEISAPNLVSFIYYGQEIKLQVENVPLLVDVSMGHSCRWAVIRKLISSMMSFLPQLNTLELHLNLDQDSLEFITSGFPKLRELTLEVFVGQSNKSLVGLISSMVMQCPFLHKLTVKLEYVQCSKRKKIHQFPKCFHQHLKVVEIIEFFALPVDLELVLYLLENATMLEKMILQFTSPYFPGTEMETMIQEAAKMRLKKLEDNVPQGVELVILNL